MRTQAQRRETRTGYGNKVESVYESSDYRKFKLIIGNREVRPEMVRKIVRSMNEHGWVGSPITVDENFKIIDGQHRYEAAKIAGIPVKYMVEHKDIDIKTIQEMNMTQSKWRGIDYMRSRADMGDINFINYMALYKRFVEDKEKGLSSNIVYACVTGKYAPSSLISAGCSLELDIDKMNKCADKLEIIANCIGILKKTKMKSAYGRIDYVALAISFMLDNGADKNRLYNVLDKYGYTLKPSATVKFALEQLEGIYNNRLGHKIYFMDKFKKFEDEKASEKMRKKAEKQKRKKAEA